MPANLARLQVKDSSCSQLKTIAKNIGHVALLVEPKKELTPRKEPKPKRRPDATQFSSAFLNAVFEKEEIEVELDSDMSNMPDIKLRHDEWKAENPDTTSYNMETVLHPPSNY